MPTKDDVKTYLLNLKAKIEVFEIMYRNERQKNTDALLQLEITPRQRDEIIAKLEVEDYCEGPSKDTLYNLPDLWVFGKEIKGVEIYIKISMGIPNSKVICISFHPSENPLTYPFKA